MLNNVKTRARNIRSRVEANEVAFGLAIQLPSPDLVELAGGAGYDFVFLDAEHGPFDMSDLRVLIRAADSCGVDAIVRVPDHRASFIQGALDLGAAGIVVPHIRTQGDSLAVVAAARYGPQGGRGACPYVRSVGHVSSDWTGDYRRANSDVLVFGLIEDAEGVDNVHRIAETPGLDGLLYGPFDLGQAIGFPDDPANPELRAQHDIVVDACQRAGIHYFTASAAWEFQTTNVTKSQIVIVSNDRGTVLSSFESELAAAIDSVGRSVGDQ